jgi:hypothetical protein
MEIDARAVFGPSIDRAINRGSFGSLLDKKVQYQLTTTFFQKPRLREFYFTSFGDILQNQILVLNIHIMSTKKLAIIEKNETTATLTDAMEPHMFRFETFAKSDDWILTDIDHCLKGNPYFANN